MIESGKIIVKTRNGNSIECDVLFTFHSDTNDKSYIVYTDDTLDELGNIKVYANVYDKDLCNLEEIETEEEWNVIEQIFATINSEKEGK